MKTAPADIIQEYGPFEGLEGVHGVTWDGRRIWFASGDQVNELDPDSGRTERAIPAPAHAGTAFDGRHLYQLGDERIHRIDPESGEVLAVIPTPPGGGSGLTWAEGSLWLGRYRDRRILQLDPETGEVLRAIECNRFVTGVTWVEGELWHGSWEGEESELRQVDPQSGDLIQRVEMPSGTGVSGLEADGGERFFCGGGTSGRLRVVRRPR